MSGLTDRGLRRLIIFTFACASCLVPVSLSYAKYSGGQPGMFLSWGAGARSLAMGKAFTAVSDEATATYWNPAAMTQLERKEITGLHAMLWYDTNFDFLSYVHPTARFGVFGLNYTGLRSGGFERVLTTFWPDGEVRSCERNAGTFSDVQSAYTVAWGRKFFENMSLGFAGKYINRALDYSEDQHFSFDSSLFIDRLNSFPLRIGFKIQNLLTTKSGDTDDKMPMTFRFGTAYKTLKDRLTLALDFDKIIRANLGWHVGAEFWVLNFAALRIGLEGCPQLHESTLGFGLKYKNYGLDYAYAFHELGGSHRFSGSWRFGTSVIVKREETIRRLTREGLEAYRQGDYVLSMERLGKVLDIEPRNREVKSLANKLSNIVPIMRKVTEPTREAELARRGIASYVDGDLPASVNVLRYALTLQPENEKLLRLLNRIEKEMGQPPTELEKLAPPPAAFTYIDQKLYHALEYIYAKQYDKAVIECQEVLMLEPNNVTALERMGSALFLMNQKDLARKVWEKALDLDPTNAVVKRALEQIK